MNKNIVFTIDRGFNIKAIYESFPYLAFKFNDPDNEHAIEQVIKDFKKWRSGDYHIFENSTNSLIIKEENRVYKFQPCDDLGVTDLIWLMYEKKHLIENQQDSKSHYYELLQVEYAFDVLNDENEITEKFNNYCVEHIINQIIGVRGYWFNNRLFNIVEVLVKRDTTFIPFETIQLTNEPVSNCIIVHDLLNEISRPKLCLYTKSKHIPTFDRNKFITKSVLDLFISGEELARQNLNNKLIHMSPFTLEKIEYKTSIDVDISNPDIDYLNQLIKTRNMEIVEGSIIWKSPVLFTIIRIVFKDMMDEVKTTSSISPSRWTIINMERYARKNTTDSKQVILHSVSQSSINYNINIALNYKK